MFVKGYARKNGHCLSKLTVKALFRGMQAPILMGTKKPAQVNELVSD